MKKITFSLEEETIGNIIAPIAVIVIGYLFITFLTFIGLY
jgi:hypothetical protein